MRLITLVFLLISAPAAWAQQRELPFDVSRQALVSLDTLLISWTAVDSHPGGVEGDIFYQPESVTAGECRALALIGLVRLRNLYAQRSSTLPVSMRLSVLCAGRYRGSLEYDGVNTRLEIRESDSGAITYSGREPGLPLSEGN